jgi:hypothetical protein
MLARRVRRANVKENPMPRKTPIKAGKFLADGHAIIILRNTGQVITHATVKEPSFQVKTPDLGTLTFKVSQVQSIVFRNLPTYPTDVLKTVGGSEINGEISNDPIAIDAEDLGGSTTIARAKILSIVF